MINLVSLFNTEFRRAKKYVNLTCIKSLRSHNPDFRLSRNEVRKIVDIFIYHLYNNNINSKLYSIYHDDIDYIEKGIKVSMGNVEIRDYTDHTMCGNYSSFELVGSKYGGRGPRYDLHKYLTDDQIYKLKVVMDPNYKKNESSSFSKLFAWSINDQLDQLHKDPDKFLIDNTHRAYNPYNSRGY